MSDLTKEEQAHARAAMQFLKIRFGGAAALATLLRIDKRTLNPRVVSPTMVFRIARLAGVKVDDVLEGRFPPANVCPHCGHAKDTTPEPTTG